MAEVTLGAGCQIDFPSVAWTIDQKKALIHRALPQVHIATGAMANHPQLHTSLPL